MKSGRDAARKHLLVFDLNGLFVDRYRGTPYYAPRRVETAAAASTESGAGETVASTRERDTSPIAHRTRSKGTETLVAVRADFTIGRGYFHCYLRQHVVEFLTWAHEHFAIGVWSSATAANTAELVERIWPAALRKDLQFVMSQEECGEVGTMPAASGGTKPMFIKELELVWKRFPKKEYHATNTLLIDDSEYKVVRNPAHTAIHPTPFVVERRDVDSGLSASGTLRAYLAELHKNSSVPDFVRTHKFDDSNVAQVSVSSAVIDVIGLELASLTLTTKSAEALTKHLPKPRSVAVAAALAPSGDYDTALRGRTQSAGARTRLKGSASGE